MIRITCNVKAALEGLDVERRQLPFVTSLALNRLANDGQEAERQRIKSAFSLRRQSWNLQGVYIAKEHRASKAKLSVVISIESKRSYLEKFEEGGEKVPIGGRKFLAIPSRSVFGRRILKPDDPLRPKNLHLHKDEHGRVIGDQRTFVARWRGGHEAIVQREDRVLTTKSKRNLSKLTLDTFAGGMGPRMKGEKFSVERTRGTRILFYLVKRVKVQATLEFVDTISRTVTERTAQRVEEAFMQAKRTSR